MATFKTMLKEQPLKWKTNIEYVFELFVFGFIPFGKHTIVLEAIDSEKNIIISKEHNNIVKIWNHKIIMEYDGEKTTKYIDQVEIYAGIFTFFIALWGILFYKHRQKKWINIAKTL